MAAEVGSAYVSIYPDTSHFEDELNMNLSSMNLSNAGKSAGASFQSGFSPVTVALGNLLSSAVQGVANVFGQNLERGIARLDTIQNFPRLMQTFGYSADDAAASVEAIQSHLDGLPGATDEVLRLTQAISDSTGSLELATSTGIAFNDMLTASGADAYTAMYAQRMFDQMMGGAAFSAQRWQGIVSKMPLQMSMVAEHMLGVGATSSQLGDALKDGTITMQELAQAMTDLGPQFEIQARAMSYGIGTAMRNVQNRAGMGVAAILDAVGQRRIATIINDFSYGMRDAMYAIADGVEWLRRKILTSGIGVLLGKIAENVKTAISNIDWQPVKDFISALIVGIHDALQWILDNGSTVAFILGSVAGAIAVIIGYDIGMKLSALVTAVSGFFTLLMANPLMLLVGAIATVAAGLAAWFTTTEEGREEWRKLTEAVGSFVEYAKSSFAALFERVQTIFGNIKTFLSDVWNGIKTTVTTVTTAVHDAVVTAWENIRTTTETVFNAVRSVVEPIWNAITDFITGVVNLIVGLVTGDFGAMQASVSEIFDAMLSISDAIWNGIKSVISGVVEGIKTVAGNAWSAMKSTASSVWNGIKTTIGTIADGIANSVKSVWSKMKSTAKSLWDGIKNTAKSVWEGIKSAITKPMESAKQMVGNIIGGIQGIINSLTGKTVDVGVNDSRSHVSSIISDIQSRINGLKGKTVNINLHAYQSGIRSLDVQTSVHSGNVTRTSLVPTYAAAGGIATKAMFGVWGESGDEALIPLSNRNRVRPFARAVAAEMGETKSGTVNNYYIDGNLVNADARLAAALDVVAQRVGGRRRMGAV